MMSTQIDAAVSFEWRQFFECRTFQAVALFSEDVQLFCDAVQRHPRRLEYIRRLRLTVLPEYDCSQCQTDKDMGAVKPRLLAESSRKSHLEAINVAYLVEAGDVFAAAASLSSTTKMWPRLRTLVLTSSTLIPTSSDAAIEVLLLAAAAVTSWMPQLRQLELWYAIDMHVDRGACLRRRNIRRAQVLADHAAARRLRESAARVVTPPAETTELLTAAETAVGAANATRQAREALNEAKEIVADGGDLFTPRPAVEDAQAAAKRASEAASCPRLSADWAGSLAPRAKPKISAEEAAGAARDAADEAHRVVDEAKDLRADVLQSQQ
ncbi:hypothetical protein SBRCBS47491_006525 [Sporothrix bragantina]|uniref:DUF6546 domain-containing protein n=1 Tax=Sporothrix bragantina TaxID=671064 RepID=A0ABP0C7S6_9PEZI